MSRPRLSPAAAEAMARAQIELLEKHRGPEPAEVTTLDFVIAGLEGPLALLH